MSISYVHQNTSVITEHHIEMLQFCIIIWILRKTSSTHLIHHRCIHYPWPMIGLLNIFYGSEQDCVMRRLRRCNFNSDRATHHAWHACRTCRPFNAWISPARRVTMIRANQFTGVPDLTSIREMRNGTARCTRVARSIDRDNTLEFIMTDISLFFSFSLTSKNTCVKRSLRSAFTSFVRKETSNQDYTSNFWQTKFSNSDNIFQELSLRSPR